MSKKPQDLLDFEGTWRLERVIEDRRQKSSSTLIGSATLTRCEKDSSPELSDRLRYAEEGELKIADQPPLTASRTYYWTRGQDAQIAVTFDAGEEFHAFSLNRTMPEASHLCPPDMYYVTYDFGKWPRWSAEWRVQGPRKSYRMRSDYYPEM
ncbi:MAG: DUF6314 family protein [Pseudomonadota bacterium]